MNEDTVIPNRTIDVRLSFLKVLLRKQYFLPPEKGAWTWWIGPLLIGIAAAANVNIDLLPLSIAALLSFLLRQPLTLLVMTLSKGRNSRNLFPAAAWLSIYSFLLVICVGFLLIRGNTWILWLATLVLPIILWHQRLVVRGEKRHQPVLDQAVAAISSLMAPAAY
ncbi:MAG: hypothetical protein K940chlam7_01955 [Chlamydiae bacterium]|nr:hypothetical protein [Chlamydiota bacterium]